MIGFRLVTALVAAGLSCASPALAQGSQSGAEKLRRLDIMLMVTSLRCRAGADDFVPDYAQFTRSHMSELNDAAAQLRVRFGERMLDRISTSMANQYGRGHPWLGCGELRMVARNLSQVRGTATLEEAADQLLSPRGPTTEWAYGNRR